MTKLWPRSANGRPAPYVTRCVPGNRHLAVAAATLLFVVPGFPGHDNGRANGRANGRPEDQMRKLHDAKTSTDCVKSNDYAGINERITKARLSTS